MKELLCIGNPLIDVFIDLKDSLAEKYGIVADMQHIEPEMAEALLNDPAIDFSKAVKVSGGGAANVAKIASMLGIETAFAGSVGSVNGSLDTFAQLFDKEIADAGVFSALTKTNKKTGVCFICTVNGKVRFAASPDAALEFTENDIGDDLLANAEVVVLDGFVLDRRSLVKQVLTKASRKGIPVALDTGSVFQIKNKAEEILTYGRSYPLIVFFNADEAIAFFNSIRKARDIDTNLSDKEKETIILRDVCPMLKILTDGEIFPIMVVKLGSHGAVVMAGGNVYQKKLFR